MSLLLLLRLRAALVQELGELSSGVLVEGMRKLSDGGRNLETLADVGDGPLDETGQVSFGTNVLACI